MVARRLSTQTTRTGNLYFIGELRVEDRGVLVSKVGHVDPTDLKEVSSLLLSQDGRSHVSPSGVIVVGDKVEVLTRVAEALDMIRLIERDVWLLQLHLLEFDEAVADRLGITSGVRGFAGATISNAITSTGGITLEAALEAVNSETRSSVVARPMYLLNDGQSVKYHRGSRLPVVEVVSNDQTVSENIRYVDVGLRIDLGIASLREDEAAVTIGVANEKVVRYEEGAPVIDGVDYSAQVDVQSGGEYLVASFDENATVTEWWRRLGFGNARSQRKTVSQVWLRAYRVQAKGSEVESGLPAVISPGTDPQRSEDRKTVEISDGQDVEPEEGDTMLVGPAVGTVFGFDGEGEE